MGKLWQPAGLSVLTEFALGCAVGRGLNLSARISPDLVFDATTAFSLEQLHRTLLGRSAQAYVTPVGTNEVCVVLIRVTFMRALRPSF